MPATSLRFFKSRAESIARERVGELPHKTRGIYVLLKRIKPKGYEVVYVGMSATGVGGRLRVHDRSKRKGPHWTNFSVFEVWDNISEPEIRELEGFIRHIFRKHEAALPLNRARRFSQFSRLPRLVPKKA
jgi:hypothetical protein